MVKRHAKRGGEIKTCGIEGCDEPAERSVARSNVVKYINNIKQEGRRVHLCRKHYKVYKKASQRDRKLERLGWG